MLESQRPQTDSKNAGTIHFMFRVYRCAGSPKNGPGESLRTTLADILDEQTRTFLYHSEADQSISLN
jgi:hypothetical protein